MRSYFDSIKIPLLFLTVIAFLYGCGIAHKEDVVAYVNKDPIYKADLKREIALRVKIDPTFKVAPDTEKEQLDIMINRKLLVQEAMERGLARQDKFVNTIRTFWEQTLIRDFLDYKRNELQDYLFVTDYEVKKYYNNMSQKATFKVLKNKDGRIVDDAYKKYMRDKDTTAWETIGPVGYDDISSDMLLEAFEMNKDEIKKFEAKPDYYLVEMSEKERIELPALESLRPEIEKRIIMMKGKRLFDEWLKERRNRAKIKINKELLSQQEVKP